MALWDIKGKALNTPVYNLLGGKSREGVLVYCHANGKDIDHALEDVARHREMGYKAIRVQSGIPGADRPLTASRKERAVTSRPSAGCRRSTSGRPSPICAMSPSCLRGCARRLARICICCTIAITG